MFRFLFLAVIGLSLLTVDASAQRRQSRPWQDPGYWTAPAKPLDIEITRSDSEAVEDVGRAGGRLELTTTDGTRYELVIPPNALFRTTTISMRAISATKGIPGKGDHIGGVYFEPSGLRFGRDATLTITPAKPLPRGQMPLLWGFDGNGEDAHLAPFKIAGRSFVRPVDHFSGMIVRRMPRNENDVSPLEREAVEMMERIADERTARWEANRLKHQVALEAAKARAACMQAEGNCDSSALKKNMDDLFKSREVGVIKPAIEAIQRREATCKEALAALQNAFGHTREGDLFGSGDSQVLRTPITVSVDGKLEKMSVIRRVTDLCRKKAVEECLSHGNTTTLVVTWLFLERGKALMGEVQDPEVTAKFALELLGCLDKLIAQCFEVGDAIPLIDLAAYLHDPYIVQQTESEMTEESRAKSTQGTKKILDALSRCAQYKVTWNSDSRQFQSRLPGYAVGEFTARAEFSAILTFVPGADGAFRSGAIKGEGPAKYPHCDMRLLQATDFLSQKIITPCTPGGLFAAKIAAMDFNNGKPQTIDLRGAEPRVTYTWRSCWKRIGCSNEQGYMTPLITAYQLSQSPVMMGHNMVVRNLRPGHHPIIFQGTARTQGVEATQAPHSYTDVSEITIEHIGARR